MPDDPNTLVEVIRRAPPVVRRPVTEGCNFLEEEQTMLICPPGRLQSIERWREHLDRLLESGKIHKTPELIHAAMRADAMLEAGDLEGYAVWKPVLRAVGELQAEKPRAGAQVH